jgi:hypothetical protein
MNKARAFLELFFAMWFVMGNVWVFDARLGSSQGAPRLYALCIGLLTWNAIVYSLPFLLFLLLCCFVPMVGYALGYNMNSASVGRGRLRRAARRAAAVAVQGARRAEGPRARRPCELKFSCVHSFVLLRNCCRESQHRSLRFEFGARNGDDARNNLAKQVIGELTI